MKVSSSIKLFSIGLIGMTSATAAQADKHMSLAPKIELRGSFVQSDNGLSKVGDTDPDKTLAIVPERARVQWKGAIHNNVDLRARLDILNFAHSKNNEDGDLVAGKSPVQYLYMDWKVMNGLAIRFGQDKLIHNGYDMNISLPMTWKPINGGPLSKWAPVLAARYSFMGTAMLQITNDQGKSFNITENGKQGQQPTFNFQWEGKLMNGQVKPLIQYSTWDNQHSTIMAFGAAYKAMGVNAHVSYTMNHVADKGLDGDKAVDNGDDATQLSLMAAYNASGFEPYFYYSMYNVTQKDAAGEEEDATINSAPGEFNDNGTAMHLGLRFKQDKNITPFVEYATRGGKYDDLTTTDADETTMSETVFRFGMYAKM